MMPRMPSARVLLMRMASDDRLLMWKRKGGVVLCHASTPGGTPRQEDGQGVYSVTRPGADRDVPEGRGSSEKPET